MAKESNFLNMTLTLVAITASAAIILGYVNKVTLAPISESKQLKLNSALSNVLPKFDKTEIIKAKAEDADDSLVFYIAYKNSELVGVAAKTYTMKGFSGFVEVMVGFKPDGTIINTEVLQHKETPGLGDKMDKKKSNFPLQFKDKNPSQFALKVKKDGGNVDAISAATISSRAYCDAIQRAFEVLNSNGKLQEVIKSQSIGGK